MNAYLHKCLLRCILQLHAEISPSIINFILQARHCLCFSNCAVSLHAKALLFSDSQL